MNDVAGLIMISGMLLMGIIALVGEFSDEIVKIIRAIRGDKDE